MYIQESLYDDPKYRPSRSKEWDDLKTRLDNYKKTHKGRAESKGVVDRFLAAQTLIQAKKILKGKM